jgi:hypothetical protein
MSGPELLAAFFERHATNMTRFAEENGIDRVRLLRLLKSAREGKTVRVSVNFALELERATKGEVPVAAWASPAESTNEEKGAA